MKPCYWIRRQYESLGLPFPYLWLLLWRECAYILYLNAICMSCDKNLLLFSLRCKTKFGKYTAMVLCFSQIQNMFSDQIFENKSWTGFARIVVHENCLYKYILKIINFFYDMTQRKSIQQIHYNFLCPCQISSYCNLVFWYMSVPLWWTRTFRRHPSCHFPSMCINVQFDVSHWRYPIEDTNAT